MPSKKWTTDTNSVASRKSDLVKDSYDQVVMGLTSPFTERDFNEAQEIQNVLRSELLRASVHSGFIRGMDAVAGNFGANGAIQVNAQGVATYAPTTGTLNAFAMRKSGSEGLYNDYQAVVNGVILNLNSSYKGVLDITLPTAPTYGTREDLVFLEMWKAEIGYDDTRLPYGSEGSGNNTTFEDTRLTNLNKDQSTRMQWRWRFRTVAGVDFNSYTEGFKKKANGWGAKVLAQGGNSTPVSFDLGAPYLTEFHEPDPTFFANESVFVGDSNLYVAGENSTYSKNLLKTVDGYVYAIPLFRVKRRNSGGYRRDNLNGARDFRSVNFAYVPATTGQTQQVTLLSGDTKNLFVGESLSNSSGTKIWSIESIDSNATMTLKFLIGSGAGSGNATYYVTDSYRPDGLWANVIDQSDIVDLRHRVSLTGFNYQHLMEDSFDRLLRGELSTKEGKTTTKEQYGLVRAPLGINQELQPVRIKRPDGTEASLLNLLGSAGNCEDVTKFTIAGGTLSLDTVVKSQGISSVQGTTNVSSGTLQIRLVTPKVDTSKYYLVAADVYNGLSSMFLSVRSGDGTVTIKDSATITSIGWSTVYVKLSPTDLAGQNTLRIDVRGSISATGQKLNVDAIRLYPISSADSALIDTDSSWTGSANIATKFPYVDSYPNFVENLLPPFSEWAIHANAKVVEPYKLTLNATAADQKSSIMVIVKPSTPYRYTGATNGTLAVEFFDQSGTYLSFTFNSLFTTPSNCTKVWVRAYGASSGTFTFSNLILEQVSYEGNPFVPYGRWFLPPELGNEHLGQKSIYHYDSVNGTNFQTNRSIFSDAQAYEVRSDVIEAMKTPQAHIKATQATDGLWTAGDTIKVKSDYGAVMGVVDSDTALARLTANSTSGGAVYLDTVEGISVGDKIRFINYSFNVSGDLTVASIDTTAKSINVGMDVSAYTLVGYWGIMEATSSSSLPTVTATGIAGTWTGLGTKEATYTISTAPTTNTSSIKIDYSVAYPAGQGITNVSTDVLRGEVNGQRVVTGTTISAKANLVGKVVNSTDACPHTAKYNLTQTTLQTPSGSWSEFAQISGYNAISSLDGTVHSTTANVANVLVQHLFSFDLIRTIEDKYGEGVFADCVDTAAKVAKAKLLCSKITGSWWGHGSGPAISRAYLVPWRSDNSSWWTGYSIVNPTTSGVVSKLTRTVPYPDSANLIDSNGFVHYIAYPDASDGTTASTITTDYVELEIELNVAETGYTVLQPENPFPVLNQNLSTSNQAFPVDTSDWRINIGYMLNGNSSNSVLSVPSAGVIRVDLTSFSNDQRGIGVGELSIPIGLNTVSCKVRASQDFLYAVASTWNNGFTWGTTAKTFSASSTEWRDLTLTFNCKDGKFNFAAYLASWSAGETIPVSWIEVKDFKVETGYPSNTWTPGRKKKVTLNYLGKVAGSTIENPHNAGSYVNASILNPSQNGGWAGVTSQAWYDNQTKQDGLLSGTTTPTTGQYAQQMYEFDLSHLGMSLSELKKALRKVTATFVGYGKGDNGGVATYGAVMKVWDATTLTGAWSGSIPISSGKSTPWSSSLSYTDQFVVSLSNSITRDQKAYVIVHSQYPAGAASQAELYTDYIKLDIELADYVDYVKANIVKVRPETKEIKLAFPARSYKLLGGGNNSDVVSINYRYVPYQGTFTDTGRTAFVVHAADKIFVHSYGTGKYPVASQDVGGASRYYTLPMSPHLPLRGTDYSLLLDSAQAFFNSAGGYSKAYTKLPIVGDLGYVNYQVELRAGRMYAHTGNYKPTRGYSNLSSALVVEAARMPSGRYQFVYSALVVENNELLLLVATSVTNPMGSGGQIDFTDTTCATFDLFKLPGRPLIKGV